MFILIIAVLENVKSGICDNFLIGLNGDITCPPCCSPGPYFCYYDCNSCPQTQCENDCYWGYDNKCNSMSECHDCTSCKNSDTCSSIEYCFFDTVSYRCQRNCSFFSTSETCDQLYPFCSWSYDSGECFNQQTCDEYDCSCYTITIDCEARSNCMWDTNSHICVENDRGDGNQQECKDKYDCSCHTISSDCQTKNNCLWDPNSYTCAENACKDNCSQCSKDVCSSMETCYWYGKIEYMDEFSRCYDSRHTCKGEIGCLECEDKETCDKRGRECKWKAPNCEQGEKPSGAWKYIVGICGGTVGGIIFIVIVCGLVCYTCTHPSPRSPKEPETEYGRKIRKEQEATADRTRRENKEIYDQKMREYLADPKLLTPPSVPH